MKGIPNLGISSKCCVRKWTERTSRKQCSSLALNLAKCAYLIFLISEFIVWLGVTQRKKWEGEGDTVITLKMFHRGHEDK